MTTTTIQIGQCGCQLGAATLDALRNTDESLHPFFHTPSSSSSSSSSSSLPTARAILVDTEPKVIDTVLSASRPSWRYRPSSSLVLSQGGAANNWARGYSLINTPHVASVVDLVRQDMERSDAPSTIHVMHSMAGGTGSGLGCAVTETVREEFGAKVLLLNTVVAPFHSGEVIVQDYNAVLTIAKLQAHSDLVVAHENETASRACKKLYDIPSPQITDLNRVLGGLTSSFLLPASDGGGDAAVPGDLSDVVRFMAPHGGFKVSSGLWRTLVQLFCFCCRIRICLTRSRIKISSQHHSVSSLLFSRESYFP